jgi:hypothetical protein
MKNVRKHEEEPEEISIQEIKEIIDKKKEWSTEEAEVKAFKMVTEKEKVKSEEPIDLILRIIIGKQRLIKADLGGDTKEME